MAAALFYAWDRLGRPWTLTGPLVEFNARLRVALPKVVLGTLGDATHLAAVPPQDHTPYSADGYPLSSPTWVVHATDVMHHPESGVDCAVLVPYWLREARAGRMPWLKYIIWQATIYDVRHGWVAQPSSGHYDHAHLSARTDTESAHLGAWSPVPEDLMSTGSEVLHDYIIPGSFPLPAEEMLKQAYRVGRPGGPVDQILTAVQTLAAADANRDAATLAAIQALTAGGTSVDTAAVITAIGAARDEARAAYTDMHDQLAAAIARATAAEDEVAQLRHQLAAGAAAEAAALETP